MKYLKTYNERLGDKLSAPSDEDVLSKLKNLSTEDILKQSLENNFKTGFKYILDKRRNELTDDEIYILEKYIFNKHQDKEKPYETWFKEKLSGLESFPYKYNNNTIIYKKNNDVLFNYNLKTEIFYYDYNKIYLIFKSNFKLNELSMNMLVKGTVEEHLNLNVEITECVLLSVS